MLTSREMVLGPMAIKLSVQSSRQLPALDLIVNDASPYAIAMCRARDGV